MSSDNQESLTKFIESSKHTQLANTIMSGAGFIISSLATIFVAVKAYKKHRTSPARRVIRQKGRIEKIQSRHQTEIQKLKLRQQAEMKRELLELQILKREAKHEAIVKEFEVGLEKTEERQSIVGDQKAILAKNGNFLNDLKDKGERASELPKEQIEKVKDKVKGVTDQLGSLKDKFFGSDKEK